MPCISPPAGRGNTPPFLLLCSEVIITGMRRGELLGLKWENANFAARTLRIGNIIYSPDHGIYETTPKTEKSRRTIALPSETVGLPREYRIWQNTERLRLGPAKALKNTAH